ncbi:MAG: hypothetical protein PVG81_14040 [Desulfobacterales bacterium]|jgi:hypothetical protein
MLRFFSNRELSAGLSIPLARWKRWAREFLPPDPLGGLQSGVARQFSVDEALIVFLGGHLVAELKTSVPDARQILKDLTPCLRDIGLFANSRIHERFSVGAAVPITFYTIFIYRERTEPGLAARFTYMLRGEISRTSQDHGGRTVYLERYIEERIPLSAQSLPKQLSSRTLSISTMADFFVNALGLDRGHFPILSGQG